MAPAPMPAVPMGPGTGFCSECGRPHPMNQLVMIGNASVCAQCKPVYLQRVREGGQAIGARHYGGFWIRFAALMIDGVILDIGLVILFIPLFALIGGTAALTDLSAQGPIVLLAIFGYYILIIALAFYYQIYFISKRGGTPGKLILGLRIVRVDGSMLSKGQAAGRYLCYLVDFMTLYIGFLIAAFDEEKRTLHDRICDTRVIYSK